MRSGDRKKLGLGLGLEQFVSLDLWIKLGLAVCVTSRRYRQLGLGLGLGLGSAVRFSRWPDEVLKLCTCDMQYMQLTRCYAIYLQYELGRVRVRYSGVVRLRPRVRAEYLAVVRYF